MINFIKRLFSVPAPPSGEKGDLLRLARGVESRVDRLANEIFVQYKELLLIQNITYIVPAVWGAAKEAELTAEQKEINGKAVPVLKEMLTVLDFRGLDPEQEFALIYILRSLIVSKIVYMIEGSKRHLAEEQQLLNQQFDFLHDIEPMGQA
jgi:hypothetical protein